MNPIGPVSGGFNAYGAQGPSSPLPPQTQQALNTIERYLFS